ncbi:MAG: DNA (cytosine-5-)-methyltransferase [Eubacteriaceae bacterium]
MEKTVVELFAGVGGFRLGLSKSSKDWDFVWSNQWEPSRKAQDAFNCYINHFGDKKIHINEDINKIEKTIIPKHNLLVGGFPCQDYSVAATGANGIQGKKGVLWWSIYDTLKAKKPPFVLLENVDRLLKSPSSQRGKDFGIMLGCFASLGYSVEWRVINAGEYGFPQRRRRVFIFASHSTTKYEKKLHENNLFSRLHKEGFFCNQFPINDNIRLANELFIDYNEISQLSKSFKDTFYNTGIMNNGKVYTEETKPKYDNKYITLADILQTGEIEEKYFLTGEIEDWHYMKGAKKIERTSKSGHSYIFSEGAIPFPDDIMKSSRTMLTSESSKNRSTHIIQDFKTGKYRKLTPIECERLNGFDDDWTNTGMSDRFRYFCMGNALVVGLVEKMGVELNKIFESEK